MFKKALRVVWLKLMLPAIAASSVGIGIGFGGVFLPDDSPAQVVGTVGERASVAAEATFDATASSASAGGGCDEGEVYDPQQKRCITPPPDPIPTPTPRPTNGGNGDDEDELVKDPTPEATPDATPDPTPEAAPDPTVPPQGTLRENIVSSGTVYSPTTGKPLFNWNEVRTFNASGDQTLQSQAQQKAAQTCTDAIKKHGVDYTGQQVIDICRGAFESAALLEAAG